MTQTSTAYKGPLGRVDKVVFPNVGAIDFTDFDAYDKSGEYLDTFASLEAAMNALKAQR